MMPDHSRSSSCERNRRIANRSRDFTVPSGICKSRSISRWVLSSRNALRMTVVLFNRKIFKRLFQPRLVFGDCHHLIGRWVYGVIRSANCRDKTLAVNHIGPQITSNAKNPTSKRFFLGSNAAASRQTVAMVSCAISSAMGGSTSL